MFNCGFQGEMRFNKDTNMEGAKNRLGRNHTKTQSHEEPPLNLKTAVEDRKRVFCFVLWRGNGFGSLTFGVRDLTAPIGRWVFPGTAFPLKMGISFQAGVLARLKGSRGWDVQLRFSGSTGSTAPSEKREERFLYSTKRANPRNPQMTQMNLAQRNRNQTGCPGRGKGS